VPVEQSRLEIERTLAKYGAKKFGVMTDESRVTLYFAVRGRELQWAIPIPPRRDFRSEPDHDREVRRRWRVLLITVKAMLEAVESKLLTFDEAFLPHIVVPGTAQTLGQLLATPKLDALYKGGELKALLAENPS
jgi:hypothetical protein